MTDETDATESSEELQWTLWPEIDILGASKTVPYFARTLRTAGEIARAAGEAPIAAAQPARRLDSHHHSSAA